MAWYDDAACRGQHQLFDAAADSTVDSPAVIEAKRVCRSCPVWADCLAEAMRTGEVGVWGGTHPRQRTDHGGARPRTNHYTKAS